VPKSAVFELFSQRWQTDRYGIIAPPRLEAILAIYFPEKIVQNYFL
jgi:hypothetical protein